MNGAALRCHREALGFSVASAATLLGLSQYQLGKIEMQDHPVPTSVAHRIATAHADSFRALDALTSSPNRTTPIVVYRSNQGFWADYPQFDHLYPVAWWRIIASRAAAMTGRPIEYHA